MKDNLVLSQEVRAEGEFSFEILREDGTTRSVISPTSNLILDQGLDLMLASTGNVYNSFAECRVGTGTQEPETSDLGLTNPVGDSSNNRTQYNASWTQSPEPGIYRMTRSFRFDFNSAGSRGIAGVQLSEVSVGTSSTAISKSLIRDMQGNPTTIQLLPEEVLQVTYRIRFYFDTRSIGSGTFTLNEGLPDETIYDYSWQFMSMGQSTNINAIWTGTLFFSNINAYSARELLSPTVTSVSGAASPSGTLSAESYVPGSFERTYSAEFLLDQANASGGIGFLTLARSTSSGQPLIGIQIKIESQVDGSSIPKDSDHRLTLDSFFHFSLARYTLPEEH